MGGIECQRVSKRLVFHGNLNFSTGTHNGRESESQNQSESSALRRPNSELVDGLFSSPESLNKFKRKHLKNTAGKTWYVCVSMRVSILTFHYIFFCLIGWLRKRKRKSGKL